MSLRVIGSYSGLYFEKRIKLLKLSIDLIDEIFIHSKDRDKLYFLRSNLWLKSNNWLSLKKYQLGSVVDGFVQHSHLLVKFLFN